MAGDGSADMDGSVRGVAPRSCGDPGAAACAIARPAKKARDAASQVARPTRRARNLGICRIPMAVEDKGFGGECPDTLWGLIFSRLISQLPSTRLYHAMVARKAMLHVKVLQ